MRRKSLPVLNTISRELARRDWSDSDLARRTGLSRSRINRLKNGRLEPRVTDALLIAGALRIPLRQLFVLNSTRLPTPDD